MRPKTAFVCFAAVLCWSVVAHAQQWSGIIAPSRAIDWSQAGVQGGIPTLTVVCATLNPGATAAQINSAIASCPSGQVVFLNAGTYTLNAGLMFNGKSNVVLRGAGPDQTLLSFTGAANCLVGATDVCITNGRGVYPLNPGQTANWTAGYAKGTTSITLSHTTGLAVGDVLVLDQLDDSDTDTGNIWVCSTIDVCSSEADSGIRRPNRSQSQVVVVTGISGTTVTFRAPGLYMPNWRSSQSPGAWWDSVHTVSRVGIEDLSLDHSGSPQVSGIQVTGARDWWVRNVRSIFAKRAAVWMYGATRGTIRDSYLFGTLVGESQSYGIETDIASDLLVENNIFQRVAIPMVTGESVTGSVYGYNFAVDDYYVSGGNTSWMQGCCYQHSSGISMHLFEGNVGPGLTADQIHGTSNMGTAFRNRFTGLEPGKVQQTDAVHVYSYNRYFNIIGNVLGTSGFHTNYEGFPSSATTPGPSLGASTSIYMLGWSGNERKYSTMVNDLLVRATMMRWGNYDTLSGAARWQSSEVPSDVTPFGNPVPSSQILPSSFYLSAKPAWFGGVPWPPIGPDVTGGNMPAVGGHAHKIPAQLCFENVMGGVFGSSVLNFNAANCYASAPPSAPPATPSGLTIN